MAWIFNEAAKIGESQSTEHILSSGHLFEQMIFFGYGLDSRLLSVFGVLFIPFPIVVFIFTGALAFASAVQLIYALRAGDEFRMDILFPEKEDTRPAAIRKTVRAVQWIQAASVTIAAIFFYGITITPFLIRSCHLNHFGSDDSVDGRKERRLLI